VCDCLKSTCACTRLRKFDAKFPVTVSSTRTSIGPVIVIHRLLPERLPPSLRASAVYLPVNDQLAD